MGAVNIFPQATAYRIEGLTKPPWDGSCPDPPPQTIPISFGISTSVKTWVPGILYKCGLQATADDKTSLTKVAGSFTKKFTDYIIWKKKL